MKSLWIKLAEGESREKKLKKWQRMQTKFTTKACFRASAVNSKSTNVKTTTCRLCEQRSEKSVGQRAHKNRAVRVLFLLLAYLLLLN